MSSSLQTKITDVKPSLDHGLHLGAHGKRSGDYFIIKICTENTNQTVEALNKIETSQQTNWLQFH